MGTADVVLGELEGVAEGVVHVGLSREVHHGVDLLGPHDVRHEIGGSDVAFDEFKVEDTRLKELTQVVTESSKEIQLLRKDLLDIRSIEQSYIEKCLADRQCKAVMGERLGVE